ncbi:MAG: hypothetical protein U0836_16160 [Pirellulales bacterium]
MSAKRPKFNPRDYGLDLTLPQFRALVAKAFDCFDTRHDKLTVDELLLNPQVAVQFCDEFRQRSGAALEDHQILRALLNHRKNKRARQ